MGVQASRRAGPERRLARVHRWFAPLLACLFVLVTAGLFVLVTFTSDHPDDMDQICGRYTLVQSRKSWSDAREHCQSRGGDLASPRDASEWRSLVGCYPEKAGRYFGVYYANDEVWLAGYSQRGTGSLWRFLPS